MANLLPNAAFLELSTGWTKTSQLTLSVDEAATGSPGRAVMLGSGSTTAASQAQYITTAPANRASFPAASVLEVAAGVWASAAGVSVLPVVTVFWFNDAGTAQGSTVLTVRAAENTLSGEAKAGLRPTFRSVRQRVTAPAAATKAELRIAYTAATSGTAVVLALLKPMIALIPPGRTDPLAFDPGVHSDTDLKLGVWPEALKAFQSGPGSEPLPGRVEMQAGAGRPASRRTAVDPARRLTGRVRCDPVQRALLEDFWRTGAGDFYIVEPDSDRLCIASWAEDGAPRMAESRGPSVMMDVGLWLETA